MSDQSGNVFKKKGIVQSISDRFDDFRHLPFAAGGTDRDHPEFHGKPLMLQQQGAPGQAALEFGTLGEDAMDRRPMRPVGPD